MQRTPCLPCHSYRRCPGGSTEAKPGVPPLPPLLTPLALPTLAAGERPCEWLRLRLPEAVWSELPRPRLAARLAPRLLPRPLLLLPFELRFELNTRCRCS